MHHFVFTQQFIFLDKTKILNSKSRHQLIVISANPRGSNHVVLKVKEKIGHGIFLLKWPGETVESHDMNYEEDQIKISWDAIHS